MQCLSSLKIGAGRGGARGQPGASPGGGAPGLVQVHAHALELGRRVEEMGRDRSPCCTDVVPPLSVPMMDPAFSAVTLWNSAPLGSTCTRGPSQHNRMQPTPRTSTSSVNPASWTAFSRLVFTASELAEVQPAAMQTRRVTGLREAIDHRRDGLVLLFVRGW